nr:hypothetical protein [Acidipropionibacterium jensenii]
MEIVEDGGPHHLHQLGEDGHVALELDGAPHLLDQGHREDLPRGGTPTESLHAQVLKSLVAELRLPVESPAGTDEDVGLEPGRVDVLVGADQFAGLVELLAEPDTHLLAGLQWKVVAGDAGHHLPDVADPSAG